MDKRQGSLNVFNISLYTVAVFKKRQCCLENSI